MLFFFQIVYSFQKWMYWKCIIIYITLGSSKFDVQASSSLTSTDIYLNIIKHISHKLKNMIRSWWTIFLKQQINQLEQMTHPQIRSITFIYKYFLALMKIETYNPAVLTNINWSIFLATKSQCRQWNITEIFKKKRRDTIYYLKMNLLLLALNHHINHIVERQPT